MRMETSVCTCVCVCTVSMWRNTRNRNDIWIVNQFGIVWLLSTHNLTLSSYMACSSLIVHWIIRWANWKKLKGFLPVQNVIQDFLIFMINVINIIISFVFYLSNYAQQFHGPKDVNVGSRPPSPPLHTIKSINHDKYPSANECRR